MLREELIFRPPHSALETLSSIRGCKPNPGPDGYDMVLVHPAKRAEASGDFRLTTNNRMEIFDAIAGPE